MRQKKDFDRHHRVHELPDIPDNTNVWVTSGETPIQGQVQSSAGAPRSYIVETRAERYCHFSITIDTKATIHDTE